MPDLGKETLIDQNGPVSMYARCSAGGWLRGASFFATLGLYPGIRLAGDRGWVAVARLAEQLKVDAAQLRSYGRRAQTRTEHVRLVARYLGWRPAGAMECDHGHLEALDLSYNYLRQFTRRCCRRCRSPGVPRQRTC
nr:DUF4158 domain-containing protein [Nocardia iowensis]